LISHREEREGRYRRSRTKLESEVLRTCCETVTEKRSQQYLEFRRSSNTRQWVRATQHVAKVFASPVHLMESRNLLRLVVLLGVICAGSKYWKAAFSSLFKF